MEWGLPREGVVVEKFVLSLGSLSSLGFQERNLECPRNFAGMSRIPGGVQKVCAKKVRAHFSFPNYGGCDGTSNLKCLLFIKESRLGDVRSRQATEICNVGVRSPLDFLKLSPVDFKNHLQVFGVI